MKIFLAFLCFILVSCSSFPYVPVNVPLDCFDRAYEIKKELRLKGYDTRVVVGVFEKEGHAWVEYKIPSDKKWTRIDNLTIKEDKE